MRLKYLPLLVLGLLPAESGSSASRVSDRTVSEMATSSGTRSASEAQVVGGCNELREAEAVLAEQEVHLMDHLASPAATAEEKATWKSELASSEDFLANIDRALKELGCSQS